MTWAIEYLTISVSRRTHGACMSDQQHWGNAKYRYLPFAIFMAFIGLDELAHFLIKLEYFKLDTTTLQYLYPLRAAAAGYLLYLFRNYYQELNVRDFSSIRDTVLACGAGALVFLLWIQMDWTLGAAGTAQGYNPGLFTEKWTRISMTVLRICGAVLVVPLMEELFWRSFLIRFLIDKEYSAVQLGRFTWASFLISSILFGLEHSYIAAGVMAGIIYNLLLYKTKSLAQCVLAHAITNLALAIYVVITGKWHFW